MPFIRLLEHSVLCTGHKLPTLSDQLARPELQLQQTSWRCDSVQHLDPQEYDEFACSLLTERHWLQDRDGVVMVTAQGRPPLLVDSSGYGYARHVGVLPGEDYFTFATSLRAVLAAARVFAMKQHQDDEACRLHVPMSCHGLCLTHLEAEGLKKALQRAGRTDRDATVKVLIQALNAMRGLPRAPMLLAESVLPDGTRIMFSQMYDGPATGKGPLARAQFQVAGLERRESHEVHEAETRWKVVV